MAYPYTYIYIYNKATEVNKSDLYKYLKLKEVNGWAGCLGGKGVDVGA